MTTDIKRRVCKLLWVRVLAEPNPFRIVDQAGLRSDWVEKRSAWYTQQVELTRSLCAVVFDGADPSDETMAEALDFIGG